MVFFLQRGKFGYNHLIPHSSIESIYALVHQWDMSNKVDIDCVAKYHSSAGNNIFLKIISIP